MTLKLSVTHTLLDLLHVYKVVTCSIFTQLNCLTSRANIATIRVCVVPPCQVSYISWANIPTMRVCCTFLSSFIHIMGQHSHYEHDESMLYLFVKFHTYDVPIFTL